MKTILPIFMFVALCSLQLAAQQTIRYKLELLEVYSNFPVDNDNGGPDPVWKVRGSLKFNDQLISPPISWDGAKRNVSSTGWFSDMDYGTDLPYVLADETLAYPGNGILDLCDNAIGFQIGDAAIGGLIAYEFDGNFGNIFNNGEEEDEYVRIYTTGVAMQAQYGEHGIEREFEILSENVPSADGSANNNDNWGWRFRVTMWIESGITGFVAVGEEGEPIEQVCEGGQYSLYARTEPGFTGGYFIFERSLDGGNTWDLYSGPSTRNYIRLEASYNTDIQYRVRLDGGPCLGGNPDNFIIFDPSNLPVRPSIQTSDFEISTTATCAGGDDGTLTLEALDVSNLPPDTDVRVQLEPVGADESDFVVPTDIILLGELPYTFTGLEAGDYVVNITALNVNDENVTSNCTVATPTITVEAIQLWEVDYVTAEGGTCTDDQGAADVWTNFPGFLPDPLNELLDSNGDVLYSSTDYTTAIFYQSLDPGDYQVRLTMGGCTTLSDVFTVPGPPAAAQLGTVTKFPQTPDYDIGCEFGQVDIQIEVPLGAPTYYIRLDNLDFPGTARGWSNQSAGSLLQTTASVGNYEITYTREDNGCRLSDNFEVTLDPLQIDRVEAPESEIVAVSGCTPNSGQVSLDVYGGRAPYTAFIDDIEVTPTSTTDFGTYTRLVIDEVAPYWHEARVEDVNGCRRFESFFIPANMAIGLDLQSSFDDLFVECYGGAEGLIRLVGSGGDGNYEYKIVETDNTYGPDNVFTDLPAGFYTCFMRDGLGCETSLVARVDEEFEITIDRVEVDPIYCTGSTARINVFIDGVFTCKSSNPNPLPHVAYEISTDGGATYFSVSEEEAEVVTSHPLGDCSSISVIYLDRFAGDFDIMVKKTGTDCESTNMMSITADQFVEPDAPLAISVVDTRDINCFGENNGFITAEVSGGYGQYRVELVQFSTLTPVPAGATVVDTKDLAEPGSVTFTSLSASPPGTGYGVQVKSSLIAGTDDFQVEGCLAQAPGRWLDSEDFVPIVLTGPDELDIGELTVLELRECDGTGGLIEVSGTTGGTPPYEYNINDGVYSTSPLLAANRRNNIVRVRDANGCIENAPTVRVNERDDFPLNVEFELLPPVGCDYERYGKFTITEGTGPFNLVYGQVFVETIDDARTLSGGASVYVLSELLETGTVYVELRDAATCFREFQFEIPNDAYDYEPLTGTTTVTPETCLSSGDGQVTITASGGVPPYTIVFAGNEIPGITYTAENLGTGIHYFGIRDAAGCVISVSAALNPINGGLSADYTSTPSAPCPDSNNGSLTISPIGGQGPYTLTWLDPDGFTVNNIAEGSSTTRNGLGREFEYDYEIMDNLGCIASFSALVTGVDPFEAVIDEVVQPSCAGLANGSISLAILVDGDPAPGTFLVSVNGAPPVEQTTFDNLPPDTYEFVVESDDGCAFTEELIVELTNQVTLSASAAATDVACQGGSTGSITVTAAGGSGDFQYSLDNGGSFQASPIFTGLSANTYDILVEESSGCQIIVADVVVADGITLAANFAATAVDCNGAATGSIMATPTNGSPPFTISIDGGTPIDGLTANGLSAGTYEAIVSDANGCTVTSAPLTIDEPTALTLVASSNEGPLCNGDATGMVTLFADGGTPLYEYRLAGQLFSDEATFSGLDDGNYSFEVRDANGCITLLEDVVVQDPPAIEITLIESTPDFCGQSNGTAEVEATGGTGQLTYSWPNGDDTPMTTNLNAGIVLVTVTDANNCEETLEVLIGEVAAPTINIISVVDAFCTDNNGSIIVEGVGGTPPYSFAWSNSANTASIDNLSAGTYDLVLMDAANCTANISVEVDFVPPPTVLEAVTDATCELENGSITLTVNDGSGDYAYTWSDGLPGTATVTNVASGIYAYTVTDNVTGCIRTGDIVVGDSPAVQLALDMVTPAPCFGETGSIAVTATGGTGNYTYAWSHDGSLNAPEALDLPAGEYTVMVMDEVGCQASLTAEVLEPALLELSLLQVFSSNCGEPTGQATVEAEGGTPPYSYAWSHDLNLDDPVAGNLLPGDYVVTLTDANDCETELLVEVANINPPPVLEIEELIPSYCSDGQGSASVQATGGNPPYVYTWSHNDFFNTSSLDNLDAGDYTITVTDESGCTDEISFNISLETPGPTDIIVVEEIMSTCGQPDGSLTVEVIGGSPPYTYEWGQVLGNNSRTISGVPPGDYYLTVYDLNDCRIDVILPLSGTPSITLSLQEVNAADCSTSNGSIIIEATNNQGAITYTWSHDAGLNAPSATNLSAGSYSVTATDALGCEGVLGSIIVDNNEGPAIITNVIDANCSNGNGEINLMVTGGQEPYNYTWSHDMFLNSETAVGLDDGIYSITVTDDNDCVAIVTETVDLLAAPELSILGATASICGAATATANVAVEGGLAPYSFTWSHDPTQTTASVNNLPAGQHFVSVTDENGCMDVLTIDILDIAGPTALVATLNEATSCGLANGSLEITPEGGQAPFIYSWSHDVDLVGDTASDLAGGTYTVVATDANECTITATFEVETSEVLEIAIVTQQNENCGQENGQIEIAVNGSTGGLTYSWDHDPDLNAALAENLSAGAYTVVVIDGNDCTTTTTINIAETLNPVVSLQNSQDATCEDGTGSLQFEVTEGVAPYQYTWSHDADLDSGTATDLSSGSYTLTVTDAAGCSAIVTESIVFQTPPSLVLLSTEESACTSATGAAVVEVDNGQEPFTFSWSHDENLNAASADGLAAGDYEVTVTDANSCQSTLQISITTVAGPTGIVLLEELPSTCGQANGSLLLTEMGGTAPYTYSWSHDATLTGDFADDLGGGTYDVTLTDANDCTFSSSFVIAESVPLAIEITEQLDANCGQADGSLSVMVANATGVLSYDWSHDTDLNSDTATGLSAGSYTVLVTDENSCEATLDFTVEDIGGPTLSLVSVQDALCENNTGQMRVSATGGTMPYTFSWSHDPLLDSDTAENLSGGTYSVMITDDNGCTATVSETIEWQSGPELTVESLVSSTCGANDGSALVTATGGTGQLTYSWAHDGDLDTGELMSVPAGTYDLTISDTNNCTVETSIEVTDIPGPTAIVANELQATTCGEENGSMTVEVVGGTAPFDLLWSHDSEEMGTALTNLSAGNYELTTTDANGCIITESFAVVASPLLEVSVTQTQNPDCSTANGQIEIGVNNAVGAINYTWSHDAGINSSLAADLPAGTYTVMVTDEAGCTLTETVNLSDENAPVMSDVVMTPSLCEDGQGGLSFTFEEGTAPYNYAWSHDPLLDSPFATALDAGDYVLTVTDADGCTLVTSGVVALEAPPELSIDVTTYLCEGGDLGALSLSISNGMAPYTVLWNTGADALTLTDLPAAAYTVTVTDDNGCESSAMIDLATTSTPIVGIQGNRPSCHDFSDGNMQVNVNGGSGTFNYQWSNGASEAEIMDLPFGVYTVTVTDAVTACTETASLELLNPSPLVADYEATASCDGNTVGTIQTDVEGGVMPYSYDWNNGASTDFVDELAVGTYDLTITDANDCDVTLTAEVPQNSLPVFSIDEVQPTDCASATGQVIITTNIPLADVELNWNLTPPNVDVTEVDGQTQILASGLGADTYNFTLAGTDACEVAGEFLIASENPWEAAIVSVVDASCGDTNDGMATVEVTGAGMFMYEWDTAAANQTSATATGLVGGTYSVTVTDENDCTQELEAIVDAPEVLEVNVLDLQEPLCADGADGSLSVEVSGGEPNYTYNWSDGGLPNSSVLENIGAGSYDLTVTDDQDCSTTITVELGAPAAIEINLESSTLPNCLGDDNGLLEALAQGGTGTLTYSWNDPEGQLTATASNLASGTYEVTVTDENACEQTAEFDLEEGLVVDVVSTELIEATCETAADGSISVEATGGTEPFTFAWSNGAAGATVEDLVGGQGYSVTATNSEGCEGVLLVDVPLGDGIELGLPADTTLCLDDPLILELEEYTAVSVSGPDGFNSTESRPFLDQAGTYSLSVEDAFGCTADQDITLSYTTELLIASMVLPSDVVVNDSVVVLETSWPAPETVSWVYDPSVVELVKQLQNQYWFVFNTPGEYELGLLAGAGGCEDFLNKTITVHADSTTIPGASLGTLKIEDLFVRPNPNQGQFEVDVVLNNTAEVYLNLYDLNGIPLDRRQGENATSYTFDYQLPLQIGSYLLVVQTITERRATIIVVQ